jgi:hypothetical protein
LDRFAAYRPAEILVYRIQTIWLQFGENAPELLFDPVYGMKEITPVHAELPAAEFPVCAQQEMIAEDAKLQGIQLPPADQKEVRHILFFLAGIGSAALLAAKEFQRHRAGVSPIGDAIAKTVITCPKNRPKYAMAWQLLFFVNDTQAVSVAATASEFGKPTVPLHLENVLLAWPLFLNPGLASNLISCYPGPKICQQFK